MINKPQEPVRHYARGIAVPLLEDEVDRHFMKKKSMVEMAKGFDRWDTSFFICSVMSGLSTFIYQSKPVDSILQTTYYTQLALLGVLAGGSIIRKNNDQTFMNVVKEVGLKEVMGCSLFVTGYHAFEQVYNYLVR